MLPIAVGKTLCLAARLDRWPGALQPEVKELANEAESLLAAGKGNLAAEKFDKAVSLQKGLNAKSPEYAGCNVAHTLVPYSRHCPTLRPYRDQATACRDTGSYRRARRGSSAGHRSSGGRRIADFWHGSRLRDVADSSHPLFTPDAASRGDIGL